MGDFPRPRIEAAEMRCSDRNCQSRVQEQPRTGRCIVMNTCPGNGISKCAFPVDLNHGENSFTEIMIPKPQSFIAIKLQARIGTLLESDEKILGLKLMEEVDGNRRRNLSKDSGGNAGTGCPREQNEQKAAIKIRVHPVSLRSSLLRHVRQAGASPDWPQSSASFWVLVPELG